MSCMPLPRNRLAGGVPITESLNLSHIWTHPALQGQCLLMAARGTTARIYPASLSERLCPRAMMESALFRLNNLPTSDGPCDNQDLEEPVGPVSPSVHSYPRNCVVGTLCCPHLLLSLFFSFSFSLACHSVCGALWSH